MKELTGKKPNIVLILADDMGFSDIGCFGGEICTPNIDRLAENGIRFTQFYNNAVCMPTRASILTGLYPQQVGSADKAKLSSLGNVTIAEVLRNAGYRTLMSGKWHNGNLPCELPTSRGFDRYYGLLSGSSNYFNPGFKRPWEPEPTHKSPGDMRPWGIDNRIIHPFTPDDPDFYATDAFTENALAFLDQYGNEDRPFFLYVAYTAPHFPIQARPEDIEKYRGKYMLGWDEIRSQRYERLIEMGIIDKKCRLSQRDPLAPSWKDITDKDAWDLKMAVYAGMIECMDRGIGRIIDKIKNLGKLEDTLIIFLSDNGGCAEHINRKPDIPPGPVNSYCTVDAPWANASNTPFRRFKVFHHEGGVSTPLIISWQRFIPGGTICHEIAHVMDFMPTFVEVAGVEYPKEWNGNPVSPMEGVSLLRLLQQDGPTPDKYERPPICWEFSGCRAVRYCQWKLVTQGPPRMHVNIPIEPGNEAWELYDMSEDRSETNNLADKYPDKVKELEKLWLDWRKRCG
ncbi:MAG: arylsulfatase [Armatimonadota bacterium]|nr:arylsulfatase [Armatimonadota bacterium]